MPSKLVKSLALALAASCVSLGLASPRPCVRQGAAEIAKPINGASPAKAASPEIAKAASPVEAAIPAKAESTVEAAVPAAETVAGYVNAVYFTSWSIYDRKYQPDDLPLSDITHVLYSFLKLLPNGTVVAGDPNADLERRFPTDVWGESGTNAYGCVKQLYRLKKENRMTKLMLSIGGWGSSANFAGVAATPETRAIFAETAVELMKDWGFDGIDVDWEYPQNEIEGNHMLLLLRAVRQELDKYAATFAHGHHFELSIAAPAGPANYANYPLYELGQLLDHVNIMAYDFAGPWSKTSAHHANLYMNSENLESTSLAADGVVQHYLDEGVPAAKMILGMPVYGRSFQQTGDIGRPYNGIGDGSWEKGAWDYKALPKAGATVRFDNISMAAYSYDASTKELISFDTTETVVAKVAYLKSKGLGGSMFWEASADRKGNSSLIGASHQSLGRLDTSQNWLDYPDSKYVNIRKGLS
ncbi:hypothetical protein RJ55_01750 [Drechmeria coniospora]|nr:hypothetical protein RJ55_01750 [Drechmeria coniospora]